MEKITICMIDDDESYKNALTGFIKSYCRNYIISFPDTQDHSPVKYGNIINSYDILLIDYNYLDNIRTDAYAYIEELKKKSVILLDSVSKWDEKHTQGFKVISKYTDVSKLINHIDNHYYGLKIGYEAVNQSLTKMILFMGISGGAGTSSVAGGVAAELSRYREKRVFFLSTDIFESGIESEQDVTHDHILYSLIKENFSNERRIIENNIIETEDNVWRMPPSRNRNVFHELDIDEKKQYVNQITDGNKFDYFIVDVGNQIDDFTEYLMNNADDIVIIDRNKTDKARFMEGLVKYAEEIKFSINKCIIIENFVVMNTSRTYVDAIPVKQCLINNNEKITNSIDFKTDMKVIVDYLD